MQGGERNELQELKRIEKLLKEFQDHGAMYSSLSPKYAKLAQQAQTPGAEINEKECNRLLKTHREIKNSLTKLDRAIDGALISLSTIGTQPQQPQQMVPGGQMLVHPQHGAKRGRHEAFDVTGKPLPVTPQQPGPYAKKQRASSGYGSGGSTNVSPTSGRFSIPLEAEVAAKISKKGDPQEWILAKVTGYKEAEGKYEVEDLDPGDEEDPNPILKRYNLEPRCVLQLQDKVIYPKGTQVLAVFPDTTSFYKAIVDRYKAGEYHIRFEDDHDDYGGTPIRRLPTHLVVHNPYQND